MSTNFTDADMERLREIPLTLAARKVRWLVEEKVQPRIGSMLNNTLKGEPVPGCVHLVDMPGYAPGTVAIDWMCEGIGLLCRDCAKRHIADKRTPHQDPRHRACIVCGHTGDGLKTMTAPVSLGRTLMVTSMALDVFSKIRGGERIAKGYAGSLITTPITWECPAHDGFLDSKIELRWPAAS
jgi:hypothetical protein